MLPLVAGLPAERPVDHWVFEAQKLGRHPASAVHHLLVEVRQRRHRAAGLQAHQGVGFGGDLVCIFQPVSESRVHDRCWAARQGLLLPCLHLLLLFCLRQLLLQRFA